MSTTGLLVPARVADLLAAGVEAHELRRKAWHHPFWGVARPVVNEPSQPHTRVRDATALVRGGGAIGGWASAFRQGVRYLDGRDRYGRELPVLLHTVPRHQSRQRDGILPTRAGLLAGELVWFNGDPVTTLARALYDEMRLAPNLGEAVVVIDMGVSRLTGHARTTIAEGTSRRRPPCQDPWHRSGPDGDRTSVRPLVQSAGVAYSGRRRGRVAGCVVAG